MPVAANLTRQFSAAVRSKGDSYARDGLVTFTSVKLPRIGCEVQGSQDEPYNVFLKLSGKSLEVACDCPHYLDGSLCKHIWASIVKAEQRGYIRTDQFTKGVVDFEHEFLTAADLADYMGDDRFDEEDGDDDSFGQGIDTDDDKPGMAEPQPRFLSSADASSRPPARSDWKSQLSFLRPPAGNPSSSHERETTPLEYSINIGRSVSTGTLVIETYRRQTHSNGTVMVVPASLNGPAGLHGVEEIDRRLVSRFRALDPSLDRSPYQQSGYNFYSYNSPQNSAEILSPEPSFVRDLCETGRLHWILNTGVPILTAPLLRWDAGAPYRLRLSATGPRNKKAPQEWTIQGQLVRSRNDATTTAGDSEQDDAAIDLKTPVLVMDRIVLFQDRAAEFDVGAQAGWVKLLRRDGQFAVPFSEKESFLDLLWSAKELPDLDFPPELLLSRASVAPKPRLVLGPVTASQKVTAAIRFDYGDGSVSLTDQAASCVSLTEQKVYDRNPAAERGHLQDLLNGGMELARRHNEDDPHVSMPRRDIAAHVLQLTDRGWTVVADGRAIRRPGSFQLSVRSGVDWFDLEGTFDFDGVTARLPALLRAVESGSKYVLLDDGSQGLLPDEWLKKYGGLSRLGETSDGAVRFRPSQAMLLDALLSAQPDADLDKVFRAYRKRLHSFSGVRSKSAPRSFQGTLRDYQKQGLGWLGFLREFRVGGCLADDMGLGKTIQVLAHLESIRASRKDSEPRKPSLAVVPKSLVFNWQDEAARFTPQLKVVAYHGIERHDGFEALAEADLIVTTYGTLRRDIEKLKEVDFDTVILDEAQAIKNANSNSAKACRLLKSDHKLAMTGTPIENHLGELWSLFEFLNPGMLGRSTAFHALSRSTDGDPTALTLLARAIAPYILRRTKAQVLTELPEKTEQTLYVDLPPKERKLYNELRNHYRASLSDTIQTAGLAKSKIHVLEALLRLRQAACHPGLIDAARGKDGSAKLEALLEQVEEAAAEGHKILVFSQFTTLLALVEKALKTRKIPYEYLDGKTTNRKARVSRFQSEEECQVFLISLKAGGQGLNLTAADYVFILDPWWNPAVEAQAIDRAHRMGQTRSVFAYRIIARDTVEEKVLELQKQKRDLAEAIISENESLIRKLTADDLQMLLS